MNPARTSLARLSTGSPALDEILGGGLPAGSVTVVTGEPGAGKTVFTLQMMFALARQGKRCLYFTTLSEPALKVMRFMQLLSFFDPRLLEDRITMSDLGTIARAEGVEEALARVKGQVEREEPGLVAIDSAKALHDLMGNPSRSRVVLYDLATSVAGWGATTLLVGEYFPHEIGSLPEFAIADGIIRLSNQPRELTSERALEVLKLRGADYITGRHFFDIGAAGLTFYPRVRAPESAETGQGVTATADRVTTGIPGLDAMLKGGLPRSSATLVRGGTGTGKSLLGLHFLVEGARRGEAGVLFTLEETPPQLRGIARNFGWDLPRLEKRGQLVVHYTSPVELSSDRFLNEVRQQVEALGARRVVLDSLTSIALGVPSERRFRELVYAMVKHFRARGVTVLMTNEILELPGSTALAGPGVSPAADNLIVLRYVEMEGRLDRAIAVLKARGVEHGTELRRFTIGRRGGSVGPSFAGFHGVLTGMPFPVSRGRARATPKRASARRKR